MLKARDIDTYLTAMVQTVRRINPNFDVSKGSLSVLLYAMAIEGAQSENLSTYLSRRYQLSDPTQIREEDLFEFALDFGKDPNVAELARGVVYFWRSTRPEPNQVYRVEVGTIVSTSDGRFNYSVIEGNQINGDVADLYFNAETNRYEIPVIVEAEAAGTDYNLPPNTIRVIQTFQDNFDGCVNRDYMRNGDDPPTPYQVRDIIWSSMQGLNSNIVGQIHSLLYTVSPTGVDDFSIVPQSDFFNFERQHLVSGKFGYDIYCITDNIQTTIDRGTADGGETTLPLRKKPVLSVQYCVVDGTQVSFSLELDQTPAVRGSPRSNDRLNLAVPLQPGQTWEVVYQYYDVIYRSNEIMQGRARIFDSDVLVRLARPVDIYIAGETRTFASMESSIVINDIRTYTQGYLRNPNNPAIKTQSFVSVLDPYDYQQSVEASVDGLQQFRLTRFARLDNAVMPIEHIVLNGKSEYPVLSINFDVT